MSLLTLGLTFLVALILVVKGSDYFVQFAAKIAKRFGVSEFIIGLTLVAIGTSLPELTNMAISSLKGINEIALGNIVGSNMSNISWNIGIALLIGAIHINPKFYERENILLFASTVAFYVASVDGVLSSLDGALLLVSFGAYFLYATKIWHEFRQYLHPGELAHFIYQLGNIVSLPSAVKQTATQGYKKIVMTWEKELFFEIGGLAISGFTLAYGANLLLDRALDIATLLGISSAVIGATVIAIGTTLPELGVSIASMRKGYYNMLLGNLIGSSITNVLLIGGIGAVIHPITLTQNLVEFALPALVIGTALFSLMLGKGGKRGRKTGFFFLGIYVFFAISLLFI